MTNKIKLEKFTAITRLGKYTYGMYLLHPIPLLFSKHILDYAEISYKQNLIVSIGLFITTLSVTIIMSYLS